MDSTDHDKFSALDVRMTNMELAQRRLEDGVAENTAVTNRIKEILEVPGNFWAWCGRLGKGLSRIAKIMAPILALLVAIDQFLHIDPWLIIKSIWGHK